MAAMTDEQKLAALKLRVKREYEEELLKSYLAEAAEMILNRENHPQRADREVLPEYAMFQVNLAKVLLNTRGVEGQVSHSENNVSRKWEIDNILARITAYGRVLS